MNMLSVMPANAGIQISSILLMRVVWTPATGSTKPAPGLTRYPAQAPPEWQWLFTQPRMPESRGLFVDTGSRPTTCRDRPRRC